jgi:hypothetical protein
MVININVNFRSSLQRVGGSYRCSVSYDESIKVATFRDKIDPSFTIVPESYIRVVDSNIKYLLKVGAVLVVLPPSWMHRIPSSCRQP